MPIHVDGIEVGQAEVGRSGTLTMAIHSHPADCSATDFCVALVHSVAAAWERITGKGRDNANAEDH
jgi:hypothetical protein